jgi:hypothetical protein
MMKRRAMLVPQMWTSIDTHRNNSATRVQMARGIHSALGFALSTSEAKELFAYLDRDGDGRIIRADLRRLQQRGKSVRSRSPPRKRTENAAAQRNAAAATPLSSMSLPPQPHSLPQPHPISRRPIALPPSDAWESSIAQRSAAPPQRSTPRRSSSQRRTAMGEALDSDVPSVDEVAAMEERLGYLFAEEATEEAYPTDRGAARPMGAMEAFDLSLSLSSDAELTPPKSKASASASAPPEPPAAAAAAARAAPTLAVRRPASIAPPPPVARGAAAASAAAAAPPRPATTQWRKTPVSPKGLSMRAQAEANAQARVLEAKQAELAAAAEEGDTDEEKDALAPSLTPPGSPSQAGESMRIVAASADATPPSGRIARRGGDVVSTPMLSIVEEEPSFAELLLPSQGALFISVVCSLFFFTHSLFLLYSNILLCALFSAAIDVLEHALRAEQRGARATARGEEEAATQQRRSDDRLWSMRDPASPCASPARGRAFGVNLINSPHLSVTVRVKKRRTDAPSPSPARVATLPTSHAALEAAGGERAPRGVARASTSPSPRRTKAMKQAKKQAAKQAKMRSPTHARTQRLDRNKTKPRRRTARKAEKENVAMVAVFSESSRGRRFSRTPRAAPSPSSSTSASTSRSSVSTAKKKKSRRKAPGAGAKRSLSSARRSASASASAASTAAQSGRKSALKAKRTPASAERGLKLGGDVLDAQKKAARMAKKANRKAARSLLSLNKARYAGPAVAALRHVGVKALRSDRKLANAARKTYRRVKLRNVSKAPKSLYHLKPPAERVSCLLYTVTFYANHAHNLTRSP